MRKIFLIAILIATALVLGCSRQKALDRIMADPEMKSYIINEALTDPQIRAQLADSIFADKSLTDRYLGQLIGNEYTRSDLLNRCLSVEQGGDWIINKLAENPELKGKMRGLPR